MEVVVDLYKVGYLAGSFGTKAVFYFTSIKAARTAFTKVEEVAENHKIDSSDVEAVAENLFDCLEFLD